MSIEFNIGNLTLHFLNSLLLLVPCRMFYVKCKRKFINFLKNCLSCIKFTP